MRYSSRYLNCQKLLLFHSFHGIIPVYFTISEIKNLAGILFFISFLRLLSGIVKERITIFGEDTV
jgi:hypothetical protein